MTDPRFYPIKPPRKDKDERLLELLQKPHVMNKVEALAKNLNDIFNKQTKVIANIRANARFKNTITGQEYIYEACVTPFDHYDERLDLFRLTLDLAKRPVETLSDQGYFIFRTVVPGSKTDIVLTDDIGERSLMEAKTFIAYCATGVFEFMDMNRSDEDDLINKQWRPK